MTNVVAKVLHQAEKMKGKWQERKRRGEPRASVKTPRAARKAVSRKAAPGHRWRACQRTPIARTGSHGFARRHPRGPRRLSGKLAIGPMSTVPAVTVGGLLEARPESVGLPLELLAGRRGLDRRITNPYIQKTGLALAGFHEYLQPGRVLIYGESEVRYLEGLDARGARQALAQSFATAVPCVLVTGGLEAPPDLVRGATAPACRC